MWEVFTAPYIVVWTYPPTFFVRFRSFFNLMIDVGGTRYILEVKRIISKFSLKLF